MPSPTPMLTGKIPPEYGSIHDLALVHRDGEPIFLCATGRSTIWSWRPARDEWREHSFDLAFGDDSFAAEFGYGGENEFDQLAAIVHDGRIIVAAGDDEQPPALWDLETGRLVAVGEFDEPYSGAITAIDGENPRIVTGSQYLGHVFSWDLNDLTAPTAFPEDVTDVHGLAAARVGDRVLLAIGDDNVVVRDLLTREQIADLDTEAGLDEDADDHDEDDEPDDRIFAVAIDNLDGRPVVLGGSAAPGKVFVWDLATGDQLTRPLTGHDGFINAIASTDVGGRLVAATGCDDGTVRLWDINARNQIGDPLTDHDGPVEAVLTTTFADRQALVTAGRDGVIRIWDLAALLD